MNTTYSNHRLVDLKDIETFRKELHAYPEVSNEEVKTAKRVLNKVKEFNPQEIITNLGKTGLAVIFDSGIPGQTLMFRAELDALPIQEVNDFSHKSKNKGVGHKCGHDGHTSIIVGLAKQLNENPPKKGRVVLLFQPAEETGEGAKKILDDPKFESLKPDLVFALHNLPGYDMHQIVLKEKAFTASVKSLILKFKGKTAHAAEPENGINPAHAIAEILLKSEILSNNYPDAKDFSVITPIHINVGDLAYGTAAGYGELHLTIRTWTNYQFNRLAQKLLQVIKQIAKSYKLDYSHEWVHVFHANKNNPEAVEIIKNAAENNRLNIESRKYPFKWGEDFGLFTQHFKGAMFGLGSGKDTPALHNPDYDFPDELIKTGVQMFDNIITQLLR